MTAPHQIDIRGPVPSDAVRLAALAERTFRAAFAADNTPEDLESYVREAFSVGRVRTELADPGSAFLLAFVEGEEEPTGYAKLREGPADGSVTGPDPVELERIYVDAGRLGRGVGAALLRACLRVAAAGGHRTIWLGVWERNRRAIAFYERWGFETVGTHVFRLGSDDQTDLVMARSVAVGPEDAAAALRS